MNVQRALLRSIGLYLLLGSTFSACKREQSVPSHELNVFASSSLGPTLSDLARDFEALHPDAHINLSLASSRRTCTRALNPNEGADIVFTADAEVIDALLVPEAADFNLPFAQNALVLAYAHECPLKTLLHGGTPWQELLASGKFRVGIANPATSPVGYRALLALKLNDLTAPPPLRLGRRIERQLRPEYWRHDVSRLIEPLLDHTLDAAFIYRSEALQHDLGFVSLNRRVDFSDPSLKDAYAQVTMTLPGSEETIFGSAALYGLTIVRSAHEPQLAEQFVRHLLSPEGRATAMQHKLPLLPATQLQTRGRARPDLLVGQSL